jgi:uncharacterized protein YjbI with pentapeptide repeats
MRNLLPILSLLFLVGCYDELSSESACHWSDAACGDEDWDGDGLVNVVDDDPANAHPCSHGTWEEKARDGCKDLVNAELSGADLSGLDLSGADLSGLHAIGLLSCPSTLPTNWSCIKQNLVGPSANLSGADLSGTNLNGTDLSDAELSGVRAIDLVWCPSALPVSWRCIKQNLVGPSADLTGADLSDADLHGVRAINLVSCPASLPSDWACIKKNLVGPGANLKAADLSGTFLEGVDLSDVDLSGAHAIDLVSCPAALPSDWLCIKNSLVGPGADLKGATLNNADLSYSHLKGANLDGANLRNTTLTGADLQDASVNYSDLTGATLQFAHLTNVQWYFTTCPDGTNSVDWDQTCCGHLNNAMIADGCF